MPRLTRVERATGVALFAVALICFSLVGVEQAQADYCNWVLTCEWIDPQKPHLGKTCNIGSIQCQGTSGDCDEICDEEQVSCFWQCQDEGGVGASCTTSCGSVWARCVSKCIPSI